MRLFLTALLLAPALALMGGCGKSDGGSTLFPLEDGHRWTYSVVTTYSNPVLPPDRDRLVLSSRGSGPLGSGQAFRRSNNNGADYWLRSDATGIYRVASKGPLDVQPQADEPPRYVLHAPYQVGTTWTAPTRPYVLQRTNETPRELRHVRRYQAIPMVYRIEAIDQDLQTPAGGFKGCMRVRGVADVRFYVDEALTWKDLPMTTREWYCPGVGLARVEREEPTPSKFVTGGTQVLELMQWK